MPSVAASALSPTVTAMTVAVSRATLPGTVAVTVTVVAEADSARLSGLATRPISPDGAVSSSVTSTVTLAALSEA